MDVFLNSFSNELRRTTSGTAWSTMLVGELHWPVLLEILFVFTKLNTEVVEIVSCVIISSGLKLATKIPIFTWLAIVIN